MKNVLAFLIVVGAIAAVMVFLLRRFLPDSGPIHIQSQGPTVERLQRLSQLVTMRVSIADVLVGEGEGCRGAWLIRGDALLGIDLSRARIAEYDKVAQRATLLLPPPEVLHPRVDHERSKTWEVRRMAWLPWNVDEDRLRDDVMRQAQELVGRSAGSAENLRQARLAAEAIITGFYNEVGWQVQVRWLDEAPATAQR